MSSFLQPGAGLPSVVGRGLIPLAILVAPPSSVLGFRCLVTRRFGASEGRGRAGGLCHSVSGCRAGGIDRHRRLVPRPRHGPRLALGNRRMTKNEGPVEASSSRRGFLGRAWLLLGGVVLAEAVWIVSDFFKPRRRRVADDGADSVIVAGPVDRFEPGVGDSFPQRTVFIWRGSPTAVSSPSTANAPTSAARSPGSMTRDRFVCPCHASAYDITRQRIEPARARGRWICFPVRIENEDRQGGYRAAP